MGAITPDSGLDGNNQALTTERGTPKRDCGND